MNFDDEALWKRFVKAAVAAEERMLLEAVTERLCDRGRILPGEPILTVQVVTGNRNRTSFKDPWFVPVTKVFYFPGIRIHCAEDGAADSASDAQC